MKRYYVVQVVIDISIVVLGIFLLLFPQVASLGANIVLYTLMAIYAGLELLEYLIGGETTESLYLFSSAAVCAFSGFFLRNYDHKGVLSITFLVWILMVSIIKIMNLENIYESKKRLFTIKIGMMSTITMMGILISINIYFGISKINYMIALMFLSYGFLEILSDMMDYLSDDIKLLKE